jgi:hypothetical protein
MKRIQTPFPAATLLGLVLALCLGTGAPLAAQEPLTLSINDAEAHPGRILALVLRTYASRQLGQGQVGARATAGLLGRSLGEGAEMAGAELLANPLAAIVFSDQDDAVSRFRVDTSGTGPDLNLTFRSPTASVNQSDGPLAVLYFRMPIDAVPGDQIDVIVDPLESFLFDHLGDPVPVAGAAGRVRVLGPADRFGVSGDGEDTVPGQPAVLSLQTSEVKRLSAGQAAFRYQPSLFTGPPVVDIDSRYGNATWTVDDSTSGLVVVSFESADHSLNFVPGDIVTVTLPTRDDIAPGTTMPVRLGRDLTFLVDERGNNVPIDLEAGQLLFVR